MVVVTFFINHIVKIIAVNIIEFSVTGCIVVFWPPFIIAFLRMLIGFIIFEHLLCKPYIHKLLRHQIVIGGAAT